MTNLVKLFVEKLEGKINSDDAQGYEFEQKNDGLNENDNDNDKKPTTNEDSDKTNTTVHHDAFKARGRCS